MASRKARKKLQSIVTTRKNAEMYAFLGDLYTGELFVRAGNYTRMYATIAFTGQVIKVRNKKFPARFKYPVKLGHVPGSAEIEVMDEWRGIYPNLDLPHLPFHPHTWGETENVAWIRKEQIMELSPFVKEGMIVLVNSGSFVINGVRRGFMYQEFDMTSYIPASGARWVTCEIDNTGAITYTEGTLYDSRTLLDISNVPAVSDNKYMLFAVKVYYGQTELMFMPDNNDLYDPRLTWASGYFESYAGRTESETDPTVDDDISTGIRVLHLWINTISGDVFLCKDNTEGAAVWERLGGTGNIEWKIDGSLAVLDPADTPILIDKDVTLSAVYLYCEDAGTSDETTIDINLNGAGSIFATPLSLPYDDANNWVKVVPDTVDFVEGDVLTLSISAVAPGAQNMRVLLQVASSGGTGVASHPTIENLNYSPGTNRTTTSSSYADFDGANAELTIEKQSESTDILIELDFPLYSTSGGTVGQVGIEENGTDYDVCLLPITPANSWLSFSGKVKITGLSAGSHTFRLRWKRVSGSGTLTHGSGAGTVSISAQEVA